MVEIKKLNLLGMVKRVDPKLILKGYSLKDKLNVVLSFFFWGPLRKLGITKKEILITMKGEDGVFICGDKAIHSIKSDYEPHIRKFFDINEGVFIDIGANLGIYTVFMAKKLKETGQVISIEPEEHTVKLLKQNVSMNNLKNVFVIGKACSSKNGKDTLYLEGTKYSGGLHSLKKYGHHVSKIIIEVEKLDSIVSRLKIKRVDLIKIDTEGTELDVLKGSQEVLKKYHPRIICECLTEKSEKEVTSLLKKFKYKIKRIDKENVLAY